MFGMNERWGFFFPCFFLLDQFFGNSAATVTPTVTG